MRQVPQFHINSEWGDTQRKKRTLNLIFETASQSWRWWNSFLWPVCCVLVPFSRLQQCSSHCGDLRHCSYLPCSCSATVLPVKPQVTVFLNITTQSRHVFLNIMGQLWHAGPKSRDHTGRGSDGDENGDWERQLGLQSTILTSMAQIISQISLLLFPLTPLWTKVFIIYALPSRA